MVTYTMFIDKFVHPFIIYVLAGTLISYLLAKLFSYLPGLKDSKSRTVLFSTPLVVPFTSYFLFAPFSAYDCILFKQPLGVISNWLCKTGTFLASILTPLFLVVTGFAVFKAGLSLFATSRITKKYGYSSRENHPRLFEILEYLCQKISVNLPAIIITKDQFARSFTMGQKFPVIVLSEGLINSLDYEELETVLAHELGHIVRSDSLSKWFMVFLRDLMFFTPVVYWIFKDLSLEKEMASDDFAVRITGKRLAFAQALIKVARLSPRTLFSNVVLDNFMPHPNFVGSAGILEQRVKRILDNTCTMPHSKRTALIGSISLVSISLVLVYWFC